MNPAEINELRSVLDQLEFGRSDIKSTMGLPVMRHGFFPGGNGLYDGVDAKAFPLHGVLVLGSNFGCDQKFVSDKGVLLVQDERSNNTWRGLLALLNAAGLESKNCFFTNAWPFLHVGSSNDAHSKGIWLRDRALSDTAQSFFLRTFQMMHPKLLITLGPSPAAFLADIWPKELAAWRGNKVSSLDALPFQVVQDGGFSCVCTAVTHPCRPPNSELRRPPYKGFLGQAKLLQDAWLRAGALNI